MEFREVKHRVIKALHEGTYLHAARGRIEDKNALLTGGISPEQLIRIIERCNGAHHHRSVHHEIGGLEVHIFKRDGWYVKFYFVDPDTVFISVHLSE
ncbi:MULTISPECIES: hypothetical protein [Pannonibacter]|uniref:hypothetical protein n=1 Tax=Pannonibacter TaxID=227873 RepID=UPI000F02C754|nr:MULTISPECIES: hypothetical protein [Pannonibacter]